MKRVINGKTYNDDTAEFIANASRGYRGDFSAWDESLYRTKKGAYFTSGSGGPTSHYAISLGPGSWGGSSGIRVLSEAEALGWCEANNIDPDVIEEHFEIEEG